MERENYMNFDIETIEAFCKRITVTMNLSRKDRFHALSGLPLPQGFRAVELRNIKDDQLVSVLTSNTDSLSALSISSAMTLDGAKEVTPHTFNSLNKSTAGSVHQAATIMKGRGVNPLCHSDPILNVEVLTLLIDVQPRSYF
jgi:hypothetical protein